MPTSLNGRLTPTIAALTIAGALVIGGGTAVAAKVVIDGRDIAKNSIPAGKLTEAARETLRGAQGPAGPIGSAGPQGATGRQGATGQPGRDGTDAGPDQVFEWDVTFESDGADGQRVFKSSDFIPAFTEVAVNRATLTGDFSQCNYAGARIMGWGENLELVSASFDRDGWFWEPIRIWRTQQTRPLVLEVYCDSFGGELAVPDFELELVFQTTSFASSGTTSFD